MLQINSKHLVEGAASEPGVVVEVVVHSAHLIIILSFEIVSNILTNVIIVVIVQPEEEKTVD